MRLMNADGSPIANSRPRLAMMPVTAKVASGSPRAATVSTGVKFGCVSAVG